MSILDETLPEVLDEKAQLYVDWQKEDDEFQAHNPCGKVYKWFSEHSHKWKFRIPSQEEVELDGGFGSKEETDLEKRYGKRHVVMVPDSPFFMMHYICPTTDDGPLDLGEPGSSQAYMTKVTVPNTKITMSIYSKMLQLQQVGWVNGLTLRVPKIIDLHDVQEYPSWFVNKDSLILPPFDQIVFWLDDKCKPLITNNNFNVYYNKDYMVYFD